MTADAPASTGPQARNEPRLVQEIRRLVTARDRDALRGYIAAADPEDTAEASAWFAKRGRRLLTDDERWDSRAAFEERQDRALVRRVVIVALSTPAAAAKGLPWRDMSSDRNAHTLMLLDALGAKGQDWCQRFVAAVLSANARAGHQTAVAVVRHCLPLILHFNFSTEDFEAYPRLWAFYYRQRLSGQTHEVWNEEIAAKYDSPGWSGVEFRLAPDGCAELFPKTRSSSQELWDQDTTAPDTLLRCFEVADALGPLQRNRLAGEWSVGAAVRGYLEQGTYRRAEVLDRVDTALARGDGIPTQRVLADVLNVLELVPAEVATRIPLLLSTVATAPGFLSTQALGLLLSAPLTGDDLAELSAVVFGRTEKKPQDLLVKHLKATRTAKMFDDSVLTTCWEAAAGSSDLKIRSVAGDLLDQSGPSGIPGPSGGAPAQCGPAAMSLWGTGAHEPYVSPPYVSLDPLTVRFLHRWHRTEYDAITEEQELEALLYLTYRQPQEGRDWYRRRYPPRDPAGYRAYAEGLETTKWVFWGDPDPETVMWMWASAGHDLSAHRELVRLLHASLSGPMSWGGSIPVDVTRGRGPHAAPE